ncbi:cytochrome c oxidase subunit II [Mesorhizobium sp. CAU 1732]|uniref:cytochrome c oxidase subunit II n=1 Tax=Mesorhizobium sp. CAU 1732 TaxID=3140358 RepID=UPI003261B0CA
MAALGSALALSACAGPLSTLQPEGPSARGAAMLWWIMLAGSAVIFALVSAMLVLAYARPGPLRAAGPKTIMVWGGLVFPGIVLTALVVAAFALGERMLATPRDPAPMRIEAIAERWIWTFRYPGTDGSETRNRLHIPAGQDIDFVVTSGDVIHAFWIPRLGGKIDAIPGRENIVRLRADRPGVYGGVCAEYCGEGHAVMRFTVEAHEEADYEARLAAAIAEESAR